MGASRGTMMKLRLIALAALTAACLSAPAAKLLVAELGSNATRMTKREPPPPPGPKKPPKLTGEDLVGDQRAFLG
jgi:hypothetical protein